MSFSTMLSLPTCSMEVVRDPTSCHNSLLHSLALVHAERPRQGEGKLSPRGHNGATDKQWELFRSENQNMPREVENGERKVGRKEAGGTAKNGFPVV